MKRTPPPGDADDRLWYVCYGSNLSEPRLQRYLDACPDAAPPAEGRAVMVPYRLFFADWSRRWGGGCAFVDPAVDGDAGTLAMAWLLTRTQFRWVLAQENSRRVLHDAAAAEPLDPGERRLIGPSRYALVLGCESPDHRSALTFTTPADPLPELSSPSASYVDTIVAGLVAGHGLDEADARAYVMERTLPPT